MAQHRLDPQAAAFRSAGPEDLVTDDDIAAMLRTGELVETTADPGVSVDGHEARGWDAGRVGPKTLEQARAALAARVDDPSAPDADPYVYDEVS